MEGVRLLSKKLEREGFVFLDNLGLDLDTLSISRKIGCVVEVPGFSEVQHLTPKIKEDQPRNTYSGNYGLDSFPLHTDLAHWHKPPRYVLLRCMVPDPRVHTSILKFTDATKDLPDNMICRALFKPRRPLDNRHFLLRFKSDETYRWDQLYLVPENREAKIISSRLSMIKRSLATEFKLTKTGQIVLIDNWKVLHGRSKIINPNSNRVIDRVYLAEINL